MSITTSSAEVSSVEASAGWVGMRSCHHTSRSSRQSTLLSSPRYRWTIMCSSDGHCSAASSATAFMAMDRPRRRNPSDVNSAFAPASCSRDTTALTPYPLNKGRIIAPIFAMARKAMTISGHIGMKSPTTSPFPIPSDFSPLAHRHTSSWRSRYVSTRVAPSSPSHRIATWSAVASSRIHLSIQLSTMFIRPPTHHLGNSIPFDRSTIDSYGLRNSIPRSSSVASQNQATSSIDRRYSSG